MFLKMTLQHSCDVSKSSLKSLLHVDCTATALSKLDPLTSHRSSATDRQGEPFHVWLVLVQAVATTDLKESDNAYFDLYVVLLRKYSLPPPPHLLWHSILGLVLLFLFCCCFFRTVHRGRPSCSASCSPAVSAAVGGGGIQQSAQERSPRC